MQAGSSLTYYRGVMVYNGNNLAYILHPSGMTRKSSSSFIYTYALTDHLGSTRVLLEKSGKELQDGAIDRNGKKIHNFFLFASVR